MSKLVVRGYEILHRKDEKGHNQTVAKHPSGTETCICSGTIIHRESIEMLIDMAALEVIPNKYPDYIMRKIRQNMGLDDEYDTSRDDEINSMSANEAFSRVLEWGGICGYAHSINSWIESIYHIDLASTEDTTRACGSCGTTVRPITSVNASCQFCPECGVVFEDTIKKEKQ
jgi:ribosomal protein S27AE